MGAPSLLGRGGAGRWTGQDGGVPDEDMIRMAVMPASSAVESPESPPAAHTTSRVSPAVTRAATLSTAEPNSPPPLNEPIASG